MAKASISKITVTVGKYTLELTLEEARALKKALADTLEPTVAFTPPRVERIIEREVPRPWFPPYKLERHEPQLGEITCYRDQLSSSLLLR